MTRDCKVLGGESCHMGDGCKAMEKMTREALQQDGNHPAPCARSCEANAYQIEIRRISAERDALAAKLAELEGQEPVSAQCRFVGEQQWMHCHVEHHRFVEASPNEWDGYETRALYARPVPAEPVNARLLTALKACRNKLAHDASMVAMADVAIMGAEAAPKAARLEKSEADDLAWAANQEALSYGVSLEPFTRLVRTVETAVLRKNGIEVAE